MRKIGVLVRVAGIGGSGSWPRRCVVLCRTTSEVNGEGGGLFYGTNVAISRECFSGSGGVACLQRSQQALNQTWQSCHPLRIPDEARTQR